MELAVGVVEGTSVRRVAQALIADEAVGAIVESDACGVDIALEAHALVGSGERIEVLAGVIHFHTGFHGIALLSWVESIEGLCLVGTTGIDRRARDVLRLKVGTIANDVDSCTFVAGTKNHLAHILLAIGVVGHCDGGF